MKNFDKILQLENRIHELEKENQLLKQQKIETNQAKELYLKIFEEFPALIWRSRLDMLCDYFNKTWLDFTGRTMEQEFGNGWAESVHPEDFDACLNTYVTSFGKREAFLMEYRMKNKHGEYRWIRDFGRPFYDLDNTFLGYIGSCYDITIPKENELKLIELNKTKDKFFAIIAHDLRGPMSNLISYNEMLLEAINENQLDKINMYAPRMSILLDGTYKLLENLLKWSQLQQGLLKPTFQKCNLTELVHEIVLMYNEMASRKDIKLINSINMVYYINCDLDMTKTIIRNLISNAIKFTNPNGIVEINAKQHESLIEISIKDTGLGISLETISNLFKIEINNSTKGTANEKGTGLGLLLCKDLIEQQHGKIWVKSKLGKGSNFSFTIPKLLEV